HSRSSSHSSLSTIGPTISPTILKVPFVAPQSVLGFSRTATICTFALPRLVTVMGWPLSATSSIRARHRALKAAALIFLSMAISLCDHMIWSHYRNGQRGSILHLSCSSPPLGGEVG